MASAQQIDTKKVDMMKDRTKMLAKITNNTLGQMCLLKSYSWAGTPEDDLPRIIEPNESVTFTYLNDGSFGSRAAVVYTGFNVSVKPCAWLLAFYAPTILTDDTRNQVYVICGGQDDIDSITQEEIAMRIEQASDSSSKNDAETKTTATAKYDKKFLPIVGNTLEAAFGLM